eukprot:756063-Hanusia_phi.AAC.3
MPDINTKAAQGGGNTQVPDVAADACGMTVSAVVLLCRHQHGSGGRVQVEHRQLCQGRRRRVIAAHLTWLLCCSPTPCATWACGRRCSPSRKLQEDPRGVGWRRVGERIAYYENHYETENGQSYYTLTFTLVFPHANDLHRLVAPHRRTSGQTQRSSRCQGLDHVRHTGNLVVLPAAAAAAAATTGAAACATTGARASARA